MDITTSELVKSYINTKPKVVKCTEFINRKFPVEMSVEVPIFKDFSEMDKSIFRKYRSIDYLYVFDPENLRSDDLGVVSYKILGCAIKESDGRKFVVVDGGWCKTLIEIDNGVAKTCGRLISDVEWMNANIGDTYKGYRSNWIKGSISDIIEFRGKVHPIG